MHSENLGVQDKNRHIDLLYMLRQRTKGSNVYMNCRPSESFINIHLIHAWPHACLQESKGGFNNQAIQHS